VAAKLPLWNFEFLTESKGFQAFDFRKGSKR